MTLEELSIGKDVSISQRQLNRYRTILISWHSITKEWRKLINNKSSELLKKWSFHLLNKDLKFLKNSSYNNLKEFFTEIAWLEGRMQRPLPFSTLLKASSNITLNTDEKNLLKKFCSHINKQVDFSNDNCLDSLFDKLIVFFREKSQASLSSQIDLTTLELALFEEGCQLFHQKDPNLLAWRESLKPGDLLEYEKRNFKLGQQVQTHEKSLIFDVVNNNSIILSFGINKAIQGIRQKVNEKYSWEIKPLKPLGCDPERRFVILPKYTLINKIKWTSNSTLSKEDKPFADKLAGLFNSFLIQDKSPYCFSISHLAFNQKGKLRALKPLIPVNFDFNLLVQFAIRCTQGNMVVFRYICKGLSNHFYAKFYEKVLENALKNDPYEFQDLATVCEISSKPVWDHGEKLDKKIGKIRKKFENKVSEKVVKSIREVYEEECYLGVLPKDFANKVAKKLKNI